MINKTPTTINITEVECEYLGAYYNVGGLFFDVYRHKNNLYQGTGYFLTVIQPNLYEYVLQELKEHI